MALPQITPFDFWCLIFVNHESPQQLGRKPSSFHHWYLLFLHSMHIVTWKVNIVIKTFTFRSIALEKVSSAMWSDSLSSLPWFWNVDNCKINFRTFAVDGSWTRVFRVSWRRLRSAQTINCEMYYSCTATMVKNKLSQWPNLYVIIIRTNTRNFTECVIRLWTRVSFVKIGPCLECLEVLSEIPRFAFFGVLRLRKSIFVVRPSNLTLKNFHLEGGVSFKNLISYAHSP